MLKVVPIDAMSDAQHKLYKQGGMLWPQKGTKQYHAQLQLTDKGNAIKGFWRH